MKKVIIGNWKMNPITLKEAQKMLAGLKLGLRGNKAEVVICPPFVYSVEAKKVFGNSGVRIGAQNCFGKDEGAFTGEISPTMLKDLGVKHIILGHSERRILMGESTIIVNKKIKAVLKNSLTPVLCFGESLEEKQQGQSFASIEKKLKEMLDGVSKDDISRILFAYEPDWAISTNENIECSPDDALTMALFIKKLMGEIYGKKAKDSVRVLYGGSVGKENANSYLENSAISGLLVGGASLNIKEFLSIIHTV